VLGVIVVAAAILAVFVAPIPRLHLFGRGPAHQPSPTLPAVGTQLAELRGSDAVAGDGAGSSAAISGTTAIVGADEYGNAVGLAYVFTQAASGWHQAAELRGSDTVAGDEFGVSVAISGTTAIVGAYQNFYLAGHNDSVGRAYVFTKTAAGWHQVAELKVSDTFGGYNSHISVAISGTTAVVGQDYGPSAAVPVAGAAYVYSETATGWRQVAELRGSDTVAGDGFGYSVGISGTTVIVGANVAANSAGRAYVFAKTGTAWTQVAELPGSGAAPGAGFGTSVAISGTTAVVGDDGVGPVAVFTKTTTGWRETAELLGSDTVPGEGFGTSVAISGSTAVIGADGAVDSAGRAYVFTRTGTGWRQVAVLNGSGTAAGNYFGHSVATSGTTAIVGSGDQAGNAGRAYVFEA